MIPESKWMRWTYVLALPVIIIIFYLTAVDHFSYTPDDAYIYLQYAKNIIHGNGISFNAGEPSYGFTSPLWLFIISLAGRLKIDLYIAAKVIDLCCASLSLVVLYLFAYELIRDIGVAMCAAVAFSVNAWLLRWAGSGMETSLAVVLVLAVLLFCFRNEYFLSIVFAALLAMVRPEALIVVPFIVLDLYLNSMNKRYALNMGAALLLVYTVVLAPWLVYARITFGSFFPNTAYAKAGLQLHINNILLTAKDIIQTIGITEAFALLIAVVAGIGLAVTRERVVNEEMGEDENFFMFRQAVICGGWIIAIPLLYIITDVNVVSRYMLLISPVIIVLAFSFLYHLMARLSVQRHLYTVIFLVTALVMLQNQFVYRKYVLPGIRTFEQGMETCLIPIATWLKDNGEPNSKVLIGDIGAVGYYSNQQICDAAGLITPSMLVFIRQGNQPYDIIEKKLYKGLCDVDFVVDRSLRAEDLKSDLTLIPLVSRPFFGMTISDTLVHYYTIYKVRKTSSQ